MNPFARRAANAQPPQRTKGAVVVLTLTALGFAAVGACIPIFNARVNDTIDRSSRFEPAMTVVQFQGRVERLRAAAALAGVEPTPVRRRQLRLAIAVVKSRVGEFRQGQLGEYLSGNPVQQANVAAVERGVSEFERAAGLADLSAAARAIDEAAVAVSQPLAALNADVVGRSTGLTAQDQADMRASQRMQMMMLIGVVTSGFGLIFFISRQKADLRRAHAEQTRLTNEAVRIAMRDPLTGLLNRGGFSTQVEAACERAQRDRAPFSLLLLDLDRFKAINDVFSHAAGDAMLKSIAARLLALSNDAGEMHLARLGGDEFAVLLEGGEAAAQATAAAIVAQVRLPHAIGRLSIRTDTSIGFAVGPQDGGEAKDLMLAADIALYRAKAAGRGVTRRFKQTEPNCNFGRVNLEARLVEAIAGREFLPFYQPQVDMRSGRVCAAEALMRWRHDGAIIVPADFLPYAEATGLIVDIERAMYEVLCEDMARLPGDVKISFNLSAARMFCTDVVESLLEPLARAGVDPRRLEVEITETVLLSNVARVLQVMAQLQAAGMSVALDDFGSGYSSLGYLRRFPFDKLKIDRMFVDGLAERSQPFTILKTIVALGRALDQTVVAEGVETNEQARLVQMAGCHLIQGYLISQPAPVDDLLKLIAGRQERAGAGRVMAG